MVPEAAPRWSILLPTHHAPDTIALSIDSVLAQTDADFELLIVGDGVDDDTRAVVSGYVDRRVRFFDLPKDRGFGYGNRAEVMRGATGRFIAFASDDDLWAPDKLASQLQSLRSNPRAQWSCVGSVMEKPMAPSVDTKIFRRLNLPSELTKCFFN